VRDWAEFEIRKLDGVIACAIADGGVVILVRPGANAPAVTSAAGSILTVAGLGVPVRVMGGVSGPTATLVSAAVRRPALAVTAASVAVLAIASSVAALTGRLPFTSTPPQSTVHAAAPAPTRRGRTPVRPSQGVLSEPATTEAPVPATTEPPAEVSVALAVAVPNETPPRPHVVTLVPTHPGTVPVTPQPPAPLKPLSGPPVTPPGQLLTPPGPPPPPTTTPAHQPRPSVEAPEDEEACAATDEGDDSEACQAEVHESEAADRDASGDHDDHGPADDGSSHRTPARDD
jgi:hypothetical protein